MIRRWLNTGSTACGGNSAWLLVLLGLAKVKVKNAVHFIGDFEETLARKRGGGASTA